MVADKHSHPPFITKTVALVGAPLSHGQSLQGVDLAPKQLRKDGLEKMVRKLNWDFNDLGDLVFRHKSGSATKDNNNTTSYSSSGSGQINADNLKGSNNTSSSSSGGIKPSDQQMLSICRPKASESYSEDEIPHSQLIGEACGQIFNTVRQAALDKKLVLTLGGDHSIAAATISGMLTVHPDLCVVWIDAHGDINTPESSPSKLYHGMPVAHLLGWFKKRAPGFEWLDRAPLLPEGSMSFIGLRDIDPQERKFINNSKIAAYTMQDVDSMGIAKVLENIYNRIDPKGSRPIHLSFDIDACDPAIAPGTGTRARGGLSYREAHFICESLAATNRLVSMDMVEINPLIDLPDSEIHGDDPAIAATATKTVRLGLELIASVLGKTIL